MFGNFPAAEFLHDPVVAAYALIGVNGDFDEALVVDVVEFFELGNRFLDLAAREAFGEAFVDEFLHGVVAFGDEVQVVVDDLLFFGRRHKKN